MKRKVSVIIGIILLIIVIGLALNVEIKKKFIKSDTIVEIENRGVIWCSRVKKSDIS